MPGQIELANDETSPNAPPRVGYNPKSRHMKPKLDPNHECDPVVEAPH